MKYFGLRGKHTITTSDPITQKKLLADGFEEYPNVPMSSGLRFVDGEWRDVQVTRHYGKAGRFERSAHLNEDEHNDDFRAQGFEEYVTRPPEKFQQLYVTSDGGKTWKIDLPAYKQVMVSAVKSAALQRARQSFNPAPFEAAYQKAEANIIAASDKASVDSILSNFNWPAG